MVERWTWGESPNNLAELVGEHERRDGEPTAGSLDACSVGGNAEHPGSTEDATLVGGSRGGRPSASSAGSGSCSQWSWSPPRGRATETSDLSGEQPSLSVAGLACGRRPVTGSSLRERCPSISFWSRRWHSSNFVLATLTT